jgi:hypothetical protein
MIVGFDDDLAGEATRVANRLHGLLIQIHPSLERVLGPRLQHPAVLTVVWAPIHRIAGTLDNALPELFAPDYDQHPGDELLDELLIRRC